MLATRDYLTVKLWDIRQGMNNYEFPATATGLKTSNPLMTIQVCDYLERNLFNLYEDESFYDKFFLDVSPCGKYLLTGAYNR